MLQGRQRPARAPPPRLPADLAHMAQDCPAPLRALHSRRCRPARLRLLGQAGRLGHARRVQQARDGGRHGAGHGALRVPPLQRRRARPRRPRRAPARARPPGARRPAHGARHSPHALHVRAHRHGLCARLLALVLSHTASAGTGRHDPRQPRRVWATLAQRKSHENVVWTEDDVGAYRSTLFTPDAVHATCEDYRAAASIDLEHDRADRAAGRKLEVAKFDAVWGAKSMMPHFGNVAGIWADHCGADTVATGTSLDAGHYIPEERPDELLERILAFLA